MGYNVLQCDTMPYNAIQCSTVQHNAVLGWHRDERPRTSCTSVRSREALAGSLSSSGDAAAADDPPTADGAAVAGAAAAAAAAAGSVGQTNMSSYGSSLLVLKRPDPYVPCHYWANMPSRGIGEVTLVRG